MKRFRLITLACVFSMIFVAVAPMVATSQPVGELRIALSHMGNQALEPSRTPQPSKYYLETIYDYLVGTRVDPDGAKIDAKDGLAKSWEMSKDTKEWTFYLREGIRFHNGDEVTAEDVKFSLDRIISPKGISANQSLFKSKLKEVEVKGRYTVVLRANSPWPTLLWYVSGLAGTEGMVLPKKYFEQVGEEGFANRPIGSGPYKFKEQVLGSHITVEAQDRHWRVGAPKYKTIKMLYVIEESTRIAQLKTGEVSLIDISRERIPEIKKSGFQIYVDPSYDVAGISFFQISDSPPAPASNKKVRMALNMAINKEELFKTVFLNQGTITGQFPAQSRNLGFPRELKPYPYDPKRARELLKEAGYADGFVMDYYVFPYSGFPEAKLLAEAIAGYWSKIGVKSNIIQLDYAAFRQKIPARQLGGAAGAWAFPNRISGITMTLFYHSKGGWRLFFDPGLDNLFDKWEQAPNMDQLEKGLHDVFVFMHENYVSVPLFELDSPIAVNPKVIKDWRPGNPYSLNLEHLFTSK